MTNQVEGILIKWWKQYTKEVGSVPDAKELLMWLAKKEADKRHDTESEDVSLQEFLKAIQNIK